MKQGLLNARKLHLGFDEQLVSFRSNSKTPILFNLDLHISVMRDIQQELKSNKLKSVRWSISGSNRFSRSIYKISDPVDVINSQTWSQLDEELILTFEYRYRKFLSKFDGFVVTHTPALSQLYRNFSKPVLVINSTRYEAPYTSDADKWKDLDNYLINEVEKKRMLLVSNNAGDSDYLKYRTGIESEVVPSFCDYTKFTWMPGGSQKVIVSRSPELDDFIEKETGGEWLAIRKVMGINYNWKQYRHIKEVLYVPHNISTMSLFELATAGVPVSVPSKEMLTVLMKQYTGVLSELSYFQLRQLSVDGLDRNDPNNFLSYDFYNWWLARADFYKTDLMPNVRVVSSFEELSHRQPTSEIQSFDYLSMIEARNSEIFKKRKKLIASFSEML